MIGEAFVAIAAADAPLTALIGDRIGPPPFPATTDHPFVTYADISAVDHPHQSGQGAMAVGRYQFDIYGETYDSVVAVRKALRAALAAYRGTIASVDIRAVRWIGGPGRWEPDGDGADDILYRQTDDYLVTYIVP